jgi:hypothetical protein
LLTTRVTRWFRVGSSLKLAGVSLSSQGRVEASVGPSASIHLHTIARSLVRLLPRYLVRFLARFDGGCLPARERFVHSVRLVRLYARTSSDLQFETQSPKTKVQRLVLFDQRITSTLSVTRLEMQSALLPWVCL